MTKHKTIEKQLKKVGVEVTFKKILTEGACGNIDLFSVELCWNGKTSIGYAKKSYFKAIQQAQQRLAVKFPIDLRQPLAIGITDEGIPANKRRSRI